MFTHNYILKLENAELANLTLTFNGRNYIRVYNNTTDFQPANMSITHFQDMRQTGKLMPAGKRQNMINSYHATFDNALKNAKLAQMLDKVFSLPVVE